MSFYAYRDFSEAGQPYRTGLSPIDTTSSRDELRSIRTDLGQRLRSPAASAATATATAASNASPSSHPLLSVPNVVHVAGWPASAIADADATKKQQPSMRERRQRIGIILALLLLLALYVFNHRTSSSSSSFSSVRHVQRNRRVAALERMWSPVAGFSLPGSVSAECSALTSPPLSLQQSTQAYTLTQSAGAEGSFRVYLPSSVAKLLIESTSSSAAAGAGVASSASLTDAAASAAFAHSYPLIVSLHGRVGDSASELSLWQSEAEKAQAVVVAIDTPTAAQADYESLQRMDKTIKAIIDALFCEAPQSQSSSSSTSAATEVTVTAAASPLAALLSRSNVLLTAMSGGGYSLLSVAIAQPNYYSALAFRSSNFWEQWWAEIAQPRLRSMAADTAVASTLRAHLSRIPVLVQYGEHDHPHIITQASELIDALREFGFEKINSIVIPNAKHDSRPDVTIKWFNELQQ